LRARSTYDREYHPSRSNTPAPLPTRENSFASPPRMGGSRAGSPEKQRASWDYGDPRLAGSAVVYADYEPEHAGMNAMIGDALQMKVFPPARGHRHHKGCGCLTREELIRQLTVNHGKLRQAYKLLDSESMRMASDLENQRAIVRRQKGELAERDAAMVRLSMECHALQAENKDLNASAEATRQKRLEGVVFRIKNMGLTSAFGKWKHYAATRIHRELEEARCALVQEREKTKEAQAEADELMGQVIRAQSEVKIMEEKAAKDAERYRKTVEEHQALSKTEDDRRKNLLERMGRRMRYRGLHMALLTWRENAANSAVGRAMEEQRNELIEEKLKAMAEAEVQMDEMRSEIETLKRDFEICRTQRDKITARILKKLANTAINRAFDHWRHLVATEKSHGHMMRIVERARAKVMKRIMMASVYKCFAQWRSWVEWEKGQQHERELDDYEAKMRYLAEDSAHWRRAAESAHEKIKITANRTIKRMLNAALFAAFETWKKRTQLVNSIRNVMQDAKEEIEGLRDYVRPLEEECSALRLFRDAVLSQHGQVVMRNGGGFETLEDFVKRMQKKLAWGTVKTARKDMYVGGEAARYYGLSKEARDVVSDSAGSALVLHGPKSPAPGGGGSDVWTDMDSDGEYTSGAERYGGRGYGSGPSPRPRAAPGMKKKIMMKLELDTAKLSPRDWRDSWERTGGVGAAARHKRKSRSPTHRPRSAATTPRGFLSSAKKSSPAASPRRASARTTPATTPRSRSQTPRGGGGYGGYDLHGRPQQKSPRSPDLGMRSHRWIDPAVRDALDRAERARQRELMGRAERLSD